MKPSELEMQILGVLWSRGASTAREVLESMPDGKQRAYTSILSVLQAMDRKGLVKRHREGLTDHWRGRGARSRSCGPFSRSRAQGLRRSALGGGAAPAGVGHGG